MTTEVQLQCFIRGVAYPESWIYEQPMCAFVSEEEWDGR